MPPSQRCCFFSFDYLDLDVFLNVTTFYRLAGYRVVNARHLASCNLAILLRGRPPRVFPEFLGTLHFYDYVCEHSFDPRDYFPNASEIFVVSLVDPEAARSDVRLIYGYVPVLPELWQFSLPFLRSKNLPLHISNYKPLLNDLYQDQLVQLIRIGKVKVYGSRWDRIQLRARPLSYLAANCLLASSQVCFGLMYPYQRGKSLSGRMWQAPLQGCIVFSEVATNFFHCPGVIELEEYTESSIPASTCSAQLATIAATFWRHQTQELAAALGLTLRLSSLRQEVIRVRLLLLGQHLDFVWSYYIQSTYTRYKRRLIVVIKQIGRIVLP